MKKIMIIVLALLANVGISQNAPEWEFTTGDPTASEYCYDVAEATDGGYVMAGYESWDGGNSLLVKTDANGNELWTRSYGGAQSDGIRSVETTSDGGYVLCGLTYSYATGNNDYDIWLIKTDDQGNELWSNTYGSGSAIAKQTSDGGYIIAGSSLIKTNSVGIVEWKIENTSYKEVVQTSDGGYALLRRTTSGENFALEKRDENGNFLWESFFGGSGSDFIKSLQQTADGGYVIGATTSSYGAGLLDAWIIKTDANGNEEWNETYGGVFHDELGDVKQTTDGGYIFTGITQKDDLQDNDIWTVKIDNQGTMQWDYTFDAEHNNWTNAVIQTTDGGYLVGGNKYPVDPESGYDMWLLHFPADQLTAWFTAEPTTILPGETVFYNEGSLGVSYNWNWSFPGGTPASSTEQNPSVVYANTGIYSATLTINDGASSFTRTEYIHVDNIVPISYCTTSGDATNRWISSVNIDGQVNTSGSSGTTGYEDFTTITYNFEQGNTYPITLDYGKPNGKRTPLWWKAWIDFNIDGEFTDDEVVFTADNQKSTVSGNISIPNNVTGDTRMRISMNRVGGLTSCGNIGQGEVEDYSVNLAVPIPQPPVADFTADVTYVQVGNAVNFSDLSTNNPDSWLWTTTGGVPGTSTSQNPSVTYNTVGTYTVELTASNTIGSDTETKVNYIVVTDAPPPASYCEPVNIQNGLLTHIDEIVINGISNLTGMGESGYIHYYNFSTFEFTPGNTYPVKLIPGWNRTRYFWRLWIDLNGDGDFEDADELLLVANNKKGEVIGNITIPSNASATDITRMRISMKKGGSQSGSCDDNFEGEVEDYNVQFTSGAKSSINNLSGNSNLNVNIFPNPIYGNELNIDIIHNEDPVNIKIYNSNGIEVDNMTTNSDNIKLDISNYTKGLFYIKISSSNDSKVLKFINL